MTLNGLHAQKLLRSQSVAIEQFFATESIIELFSIKVFITIFDLCEQHTYAGPCMHPQLQVTPGKAQGCKADTQCTAAAQKA